MIDTREFIIVQDWAKENWFVIPADEKDEWAWWVYDIGQAEIYRSWADYDVPAFALSIPHPTEIKFRGWERIFDD